MVNSNLNCQKFWKNGGGDRTLMKKWGRVLPGAHFSLAAPPRAVRTPLEPSSRREWGSRGGSVTDRLYTHFSCWADLGEHKFTGGFVVNFGRRCPGVPSLGSHAASRPGSARAPPWRGPGPPPCARPGSATATRRSRRFLPAGRRVTPPPVPPLRPPPSARAGLSRPPAESPPPPGDPGTKPSQHAVPALPHASVIPKLGARQKNQEKTYPNCNAKVRPKASLI